MRHFRIILFFVALVAFYFAHMRPDGYIPRREEKGVSMHCAKHEQLHKTATLDKVHGKPKNRRIKAMNADLADVPFIPCLELQLIHTEKVKAYIYTTRFFSHKCGFFDLRGPPALS